MTEPRPTDIREAKRSRLRRFLAVAGPGIVVMLADTDAGGVITAAQSGAEWGYRLLPLQFFLVPLLYVVQELALRLGVVSRKGQARLIRENFGSAWAVLATIVLVVASLGALLTEFSGLAGVSTLFHVPVPLTMGMVVAGLSVMAYFGSYLTVERIAIAIGAFELVFLWVALQARPDIEEMARAALDVPIAEPRYLYLVAANIGAAIMPWMIFYQQSAVVEKKLSPADLASARLDTALGAILTQLVTAAVLVATAATLGGQDKGASLTSVGEIAGVLTPFLGKTVGTIVFALGITGAAIVATIVVTLAAARTLSEILGFEHLLERKPREAAWFYASYTAMLAGAAVFVTSGIDLVSLSVAVQVMNALFLPLVLGFLFLLARRLSPPYRLEGVYAGVVAILLGSVALLALFTAIIGIRG
ncbi:MAG: divalent metal cation transporter [Hyphomicrobiales bacterium]|nr:divalent metal cation transporter [Hyphomicrobiales bacterium]MBV9433084.1 divalent metal cation transporter [Hyphomicrobiales bacterium]